MWRYRFNVRRNERQLPLDFGAAIHEGLHAYYATGNVKAATEAFDTLWAALGGNFEGDKKRTSEVAHKVLKAYAKQYDGEGFDIEAVETTGAATIEGVRVPFVFKCDALINSDVGRFVLEHKTASFFGPNTIKSTKPNNQFIGYATCASSFFGQEVQGTIYNGLLVNPTRRGFLREYLDFEPWEMNLWKEELALFWGEFEIRWASNELSKLFETFPRNCSMCTMYYGECPYRVLCNLEPKEEALAKELEISFIEDIWNPMEV